MVTFLFGLIRNTSLAARSCFCVLVICIGTTGQAIGEEISLGDEQRISFANANVTWQLKNVHETSEGQVSRTKQGVLKSQYVIEADADSPQLEIIPKARFKLSMDVFSPSEDMPGQVKGNWYVQGIWTLEPEVQNQDASNAGALTGTLSGRVRAALSFDPTLVKKTWQGKVRIPMARVRADNVGTGVRPVRGGGEIAFNSGSEGSLSVSLKLWPKF